MRDTRISDLITAVCLANVARRCIATALLVVPTLLTAQSVPRAAVDVIGGSGLRSSRSGATWFVPPNREGYARLAATFRLGTAGRVRPVLAAGFMAGSQGDEVLVCAPAPDGSCYRLFPAPTGTSLALGVDAAVTSRLLTGVLVGALRSNATIPFVSVRAAARVTRHVALTAEYSHMAWRDRQRQALWYQPIGVGIRLQ